MTVNVNAITGPLVLTLQETPITVVNADSFGGSLTTTLTGDLPQGPTAWFIYNILNDHGQRRHPVAEPDQPGDRRRGRGLLLGAEHRRDGGEPPQRRLCQRHRL